LFNKKQAAFKFSLAYVEQCLTPLDTMSRKPEYDKPRGVRMPETLWKRIVRASRAKHQRPSDFLRHAAERALASIEVKEAA